MLSQSLDMLLVYVVGWAIVFGTFVHYYHKRKTLALSKLESYFPGHPSRDLYYDLVAYKEKDPKAVTLGMLQSALLKRATDDVLRAVTLQIDKPSLQALVSSGAISQDLQHQFTSAEAELEAEMMSVRQEADELVKGMGNWVFQVASEVLGNARQRELREEVLRLEIDNIGAIAFANDLHKTDSNPTASATPAAAAAAAVPKATPPKSDAKAKPDAATTPQIESQHQSISEPATEPRNEPEKPKSKSKKNKKKPGNIQ